MNNQTIDITEKIKYFSRLRWEPLKTIGNSFLATMWLGARRKHTTFSRAFSHLNGFKTRKLINKFFINYHKDYQIEDLKIGHNNFDWINFKNSSSNNKYVYVLFLGNSKLYVGYSKNIIERLNTHIEASYFSSDYLEKNKSKSAEWVKKWKLKYILKVFENADEEFENKLTLFLIKNYGWNWVRGGNYVQFDMENPLD